MQCSLLELVLHHPWLVAQAFYLPATKHPWWWLGIRPIDKVSFGNLLEAKNSVVLVPGGVSECMAMKRGQDHNCLHDSTL